MKTEQKPELLRILLAEDDKDDCFFFDKALKELPVSASLVTVRDGEQLMDYLYANPDHCPDVLFLDLNMPRKNGFECLSEIKENKQIKDFPVIMFSTSYPRDAEYEQDMINTLMKIGAQEYIRKPHDFVKLKHVIHQALILAMEIKSAKGNVIS
jgi:CheY-like chemotaxis protein